jgi:hypothetical protein
MRVYTGWQTEVTAGVWRNETAERLRIASCIAAGSDDDVRVAVHVG